MGHLRHELHSCENCANAVGCIYMNKATGIVEDVLVNDEAVFASELYGAVGRNCSIYIEERDDVGRQGNDDEQAG